MSIDAHFKLVETLQDAEEMLLLCGVKTHKKIFLCTINTHQIMDSKVESYEMSMNSLRRIIGKMYSRQKRKGTQVFIHDFEAIMEMMCSAEHFELPEDIELNYLDVLNFDYKGQHYSLSSIEALEQNVFKYFDLYGKLNSMLYIGIYRIFEYIISIMDGTYIDLSTINAQMERANEKLQSSHQKVEPALVESTYFNEKQLIVLFEGENSGSEMIRDYAIKMMRLKEGQLEDLKNIVSYSKRNQNTKDKCISFVKEFYGTCKYFQGKYDLDEIVIVGTDAEEFMRIIYNTAGATAFMDFSHYVFNNVMEGEWKDYWEALLGDSNEQTLDFEKIKEQLNLSDQKIGIDAQMYPSLYQVSINSLLLRLLALYQVDQEAAKQFLLELQ